MNMTNTTNPQGESFFHLVGDLQADLKTLVKKEIELAKTEMGEKVKMAGRNAGYAAAGGVIALMAVLILLLGLGAIVAQLLQQAGLRPGTAYFLSYIGLGLVLGGIGYALIQKALHALSKSSLSPGKTLETVRGPEPVAIETRPSARESKPNSYELLDDVVATRARMDSGMVELKSRLTPGYLLRSSYSGLKHHPLRALLAGAGAGMGGYLYYRHAAGLKRVPSRRKWWRLKLRQA